MAKLENQLFKNISQNIILIVEDEKILFYNHPAAEKAANFGISDLKNYDSNKFIEKITGQKPKLIESGNIEYCIQNTSEHEFYIIIKLPLTENKFFVTMHLLSDTSKKLSDVDKLKSFYEKILDKAFDGIIIIDNEAKIKYMNKVAEEITGFSKEFLLGRSLVNIFRNKHAKERFNALLDKFAKTGYVVPEYSNFSKLFPTPKGDIYIDVAITSFKDQEGKWNAIGILRDITDKYKAEQALKEQKRIIEEKNEYLKNFISIVAHDIKNVISQTMSLSELLIESFDEYDKKDLRTFLDMIHSTTKKGYGLLENLLQWGKSITDRIPFTLMNVDISQLLENICEYVGLQAETKNIEFKKKIENLKVKIDYNTIFIALYNIINNAIKFSYENSTIEISVRRDKDYALITIKDYGKGMNVKIIENLFKEPFRHIQTGTKGETGSGLGMLLVYEFIKRNNGNISVNSRENAGTTFNIHLPLAEK